MVFDTAPAIAFQKQCLAVGLGVGICLLIARADYRFLEGLAWIIYGVGIGLLVGVLLFGKPVHGSRSWFFFGRFSFQPASLATLGWIFVLSRYIALRRSRVGYQGTTLENELNQISSLLIIGLLTIVPVGLIFLQPDLGSGLVFIPILITLLWAGGLRIKWLGSLIGFVGICLVIPFSLSWFRLEAERQLLTRRGELFIDIFSHWLATLSFCLGLFILVMGVYYFLERLRIRVNLRSVLFGYFVVLAGVWAGYFLPFFLKGYQQKRILAFWHPEFDPLGTGYNIIQSQIAIGSGGLFGKGFFQGSQSQLGFLPARYTDFIFAVIGEEGGLLFSLLVLGGIVFVVLRGLKIAREARDDFGTLLASGIVALFCFYSVVNIGMIVGLFPITGLPLPFVSYGGSALITNLAAVGVLLNISLHRFSY